MQKKLLCLIAICLLLVGWSVLVNAAGSSEDLVECYFTSDSKFLKFYLKGQLKDEDATVKIASKDYQAPIENTVEIKTTIMVDNTGSIPKNMRDSVVKSINDYIRRMPSNESVRLVALQKGMIPLTDNYSRDASKLGHALDQLTFDQFGSYVYDGIKQAIEQLYGDDDACYRLVVITDGAAENGGEVSFDYLRTLIETKNRYHVDLIQVASSSKAKEDTNMKSLAMLSSNTYHMMYEGNTDLSYLLMGDVSLVKLKMDNSLTTGESRGVKVTTDNRSIDVGSIYFPQADVGIEASSVPADSNPLLIPLLIAVGAVLAAVAAFAVFFWWLNAKIKIAEVSVRIYKEDQNDDKCTGSFFWKFPVKDCYRVGRVLHPYDENNRPREKNDFAIIEIATDMDRTNIGRNAFEIHCNEQNNTFEIINVADHAMVYLQEGDQQRKLEKNQREILHLQTKILIGRYTTIKVESLEAKNYTQKRWKKTKLSLPHGMDTEG